MQFKGKLMNQTWENNETKKLISSQIFARLAQIWAPKIFLWVLLPLDVRYCRKLLSYKISIETYDPNSRK